MPALAVPLVLVLVSDCLVLFVVMVPSVLPA